MASFFKDITNYLNSKYPNSKIYVISDEHFYHENIIKYERQEFLSIKQMNEHIINKHNSVVNTDDIVIYLGDFSFKKGEIPTLLKKLNGHPFLVLGNHDNNRIINNYKMLGFEDVFMFPIKYENYYLSHYPLKGEHPNNVLYNLLTREFEKSGCLNIHGHVHGSTKEYKQSINVSCENLDYEPLYIDKTSGTQSKKDFLLVSKEFLNLVKTGNLNNSPLLIKDYIYSLMLSSLNGYTNDIAFFGSYMLYKKYGYFTNFSDLDATLIYNNEISDKANMQKLRRITEMIFEKLNDIQGFNVDFYRRKSILCMIESLYANGYFNSKTFLDMNVILADVYKQDDIVMVEGKSEIEKVFSKKYPYYVNQFYMPRFCVKSINPYGELANMILQYLYQESDLIKKDLLRKKMSVVIQKLSYDKDIEDYLVRYFIRNVLFFNKLNRYDELERIFKQSSYINSLYKNLSPVILEEIEDIIDNENSDYNIVRKSLAKCKTKDIHLCSKEILQNR